MCAANKQHAASAYRVRRLMHSDTCAALIFECMDNYEKSVQIAIGNWRPSHCHGGTLTRLSARSSHSSGLAGWLAYSYIGKLEIVHFECCAQFVNVQCGTHRSNLFVGFVRLPSTLWLCFSVSAFICRSKTISNTFDLIFSSFHLAQHMRNGYCNRLLCRMAIAAPRQCCY